jgi:hypothetical protein
MFKITVTLECDESSTDLTEGALTLMQSITDFAAKVNANFASMKTGIQALDDKITALQNSPGVLSVTDQAALDAIQADSAALATAAQGIVPVALS